MFLLRNLNDFLQRNFCKEINELRTNIINDMGKETRFTRCLVGYDKGIFSFIAKFLLSSNHK